MLIHLASPSQNSALAQLPASLLVPNVLVDIRYGGDVADVL
ncbi:hypothetical protein [Halotia branconii]|uniref:Uncharacterized protein n=1 Tax=Halotia branconii CENA392 TaxID=1539056 RepID=A0AAJ6NRC6_9CYAN|nr:hypothetical protein [Halotia branconii]WGV24993.1 hypothetical protein QI031_25030 [Halotia branconii CENA392]